MYIYIHIYIHTYIHTYIHISYIHIYIDTYIHIHIHIYIYIHIIYIYIYIFIYTHTHIHIRVQYLEFCIQDKVYVVWRRFRPRNFSELKHNTWFAKFLLRRIFRLNVLFGMFVGFLFPTTCTLPIALCVLNIFSLFPLPVYEFC